MRNLKYPKCHPVGMPKAFTRTGSVCEFARQILFIGSLLFKFAARTAGMTALFVLFLQPSHAARFSGDYLLQVCGVDEQGKELVAGGHIACQAYIAGVMDYHNLIRSLGTAPSVDFCVPDGATMREIQNNVSRYIADNHHEQGPFIASPTVALALFKTYPCKK